MRRTIIAKGCPASPHKSQIRRYAASAEPSPILLQNHPAPHSGTIRVLLLNKADTRNALSQRLVTDLRRHVDEIKAEGSTGGTRALILASNVDKAFCAGADLKERRTMSQEEYFLRT